MFFFNSATGWTYCICLITRQLVSGPLQRPDGVIRFQVFPLRYINPVLTCCRFFVIVCPTVFTETIGTDSEIFFSAYQKFKFD